MELRQSTSHVLPSDDFFLIPSGGFKFLPLALFGMACVAKQIINPNTDVALALSRSRFLCRLFTFVRSAEYAFQMNRQWLIHQLFWLGIQLTEEVDVHGNPAI
jgi:hypothetical protein